MILFRQEHVQPILDGRKTQTRRVWKRPRVRVGSIHQARTNMPWRGGEPFARIRITGLRQERLGEISFADARREGYETIFAFKQTWIAIHGVWYAEQLVWVVDFEVVGQ